MKKLVVIMAVLAIATVSQAAYEWTNTEIAELSLDSTTSDNLAYGGILVLSNNITIGGAAWDLSLASNPDVQMSYADSTSSLLGTIQSLGYSDATGVYEVNADYVGSSSLAFQGTIGVFSLAGDVDGNFYHLSPNGAELGSGAVTMVPEPMTIAMLGLGGLFLRKRK